MNAIIHNFQNELSRDEREAFAANARLAGRRPGAHLKAIIFGETSATASTPSDTLCETNTAVAVAAPKRRKGAAL